MDKSHEKRYPWDNKMYTHMRDLIDYMANTLK